MWHNRFDFNYKHTYVYCVQKQAKHKTIPRCTHIRKISRLVFAAFFFVFFFFSLLIKSLLDNRSHRCKQQRHRSQRARNRARKHVRLVYMQTYFKCNDFRNVPYVVKWIDRTNWQLVKLVFGGSDGNGDGGIVGASSSSEPQNKWNVPRETERKPKEITRERNKVYLSCSDADDGWLVCISLIIWLQLLENPHTHRHYIVFRKRLRSNRYGENKSALRDSENQLHIINK